MSSGSGGLPLADANNVRKLYYCHQCTRNVRMTRFPYEKLTCPSCNSNFLEEVKEIIQENVGYTAQIADRYFTTFPRLVRYGLHEGNIVPIVIVTRLSINGNVQEFSFTRDCRPRGPLPASKSAIEALPITKIDDTLSELGPCGICREKFELDVEVNQMPCNHIYHPKCILQWLVLSNTCPLCRYELPTNNTSPSRSSGGGGGAQDGQRRVTIILENWPFDVSIDDIDEDDGSRRNLVEDYGIIDYVDDNDGGGDNVDGDEGSRNNVDVDDNRRGNIDGDDGSRDSVVADDRSRDAFDGDSNSGNQDVNEQD